MHLESRNLVKKFGSRTVVDRISVRVDKGEIVGLLGPNGAGKTTTFYMIVGLEQPTHGDVYLSDICITDYPMYRRAALGISYLTQEPSIFRKLTVTENIAAILETTKLSKAEQKHRLDGLLEEFHIGHVRDRRGTELSGGERRRVEIARCLALEPQFILLDEPFAGVDPLAVADIQEIIEYLRDEKGVHNLIYVYSPNGPFDAEEAYLDAKGSGNMQIDQMNDAISSGAGAIVLLAADGTSIVKSIE
ncbi:MAG: LPS export ABC transporter ATP-binding protein, partial [Selenomonas artemidis]